VAGHGDCPWAGSSGLTVAVAGPRFELTLGWSRSVGPKDHKDHSPVSLLGDSDVRTHLDVGQCSRDQGLGGGGTIAYCAWAHGSLGCERGSSVAALGSHLGGGGTRRPCEYHHCRYLHWGGYLHWVGAGSALSTTEVTNAMTPDVDRFALSARDELSQMLSDVLAVT
jgi:hypothetical protein